MQRVRELLEGLDLPAVCERSAAGYRLPAVHALGAALPQGHLHVWSGAPGAGKTAFLLGLLREAARHGRPTLLATYDLPASALALRLLAMEAGVSLADLDAGRLVGSDAQAAALARARLSELPLHLLEARGLSTASLEDRLVRSSARIDVLGVDYVEAVVRAVPAHGDGVPATLHELSELAKRRWLSVVATVRTPPPGVAAPAGAAAASAIDPCDADRVGWIAPLDEHGAAEASLLSNRHGQLTSCRLRLDIPSARWVQFTAEPDGETGAAPGRNGPPGTAADRPA